ncbi:glucosamine-6-phosphate deaminase [Dysosmobacter sp.]
MKIIYAKDYGDMSRKAANIISAQVILKPESVLGLATGSSPLGIYRQLILWYEKGDLDFSAARSVNLDEYWGLPADNEQSYHYFMHHHFFDHINIDPARIHIPNGMAPDAAAECARYDRLITEYGGIDLQLLGIGRNAHIGFNEPDDHFSKNTHQVTLTQSTIAANTRFFEREEDVPHQAISMGMQAITQARKILLVASGEDKAQALYASCFGPVTPQVPASILQLHQDVTIIADEAALSRCPR